MYKRKIDLDISSRKTVFLWGARQTGKSTLLNTLFHGARKYDLLLSDTYRRLVSNPSLIRQECEAQDLTGKTQKQPVIIDEIQKVPDLLDEVHWLIENRGVRFILCGSSARKLKRGHGNLLGGRAPRHELSPLVYPEITDFSLPRALTHGLLPPHYISDEPGELLRGYVGDYLKEEIAAEALTRNVPAFNHFMEVAALSNGEIINYTNIASECGVSAPTVKGHFQILEDTLIGRALPAYSKRGKRRLISAPKFYFFDTGVVGQLTHRGIVEPGTELFGRVFEHYMLMEVWAYAEYSGKHFQVSYWRTSSQIEIDIVLGDHETAIEIKGTKMAQDFHLKGLRAFKEDYVSRHYLAVTLDPNPRRTSDGIEILPWRIFLDRLWEGRII
jgi:predicted AAA+ superfamily ATPase